MTGQGPKESVRPLAGEYDTALLDLDGVVYLGEQAVPGAADGIAAARAAGMTVAFVTNNASRPPETVAEHLSELDVPATAADVVTSAQAAARLIADKVPAGSAVLVLGGAGLWTAVRERGLRPVESAADEPVAVVQGFSSDLGYRQLAEGAAAVRDGALFVATNLDRTLPGPRGPMPGNGSLVQVVQTATGVEPVSAGKPEPALYEEAMRRCGASRPLVVGDRLDTDIAGAVRAVVDSVLVLTGVSQPADLLAAPAPLRPTYLASDLSGLTRPHPPVTDTADGWRCGDWTATTVDGALRLTGTGGYEDGLRALCAASWAEPTPPDSAAALAHLPRT